MLYYCYVTTSKSFKNILTIEYKYFYFLIVYIAAIGTTAGGSPLMSSDLSTELGNLLSDSITESYSKSESTSRIKIKKSKSVVLIG